MSAWGLLRQKSQKARRLISRQRTKQATIADQWASNALAESSVSLALGDVVPHIIIQSLHLRVREFESHLAKRLLQQYVPTTEVRNGLGISKMVDTIAQAFMIETTGAKASSNCGHTRCARTPA
jgi:hypothetical protein